MVFCIDNELLTRAKEVTAAKPAACFRLAEEFGPLAPWMLRDDVLESARQAGERDDWIVRQIRGFLDRGKRLYADPGAAHAILVFDSKEVQDTGALRRAFILPLQWRQGVVHDAGLPQALRDLAEEVRSQLELTASPWTLHLHPSLNEANLSNLEVRTWNSAWAPLAAGLCLAEQGGKPDNTIAATGYFDGTVIVEVDRIEHKAEVAREFGCQTLFYSADQSTQAALAPMLSLLSGLKLRPFPSNPLSDGKTPKARSFLQECLFELEAEPEADDVLPLRLAYANRFPQHLRAQRDQFMATKLTVNLAERLRSGSLPTIEHLAVLMSAPSAALLSLLVFRPAHSKVFFTQRDELLFDPLRKYLSSARSLGHPVEDPEPELLQYRPGTVDQVDLEHVTASVRAFLEQAGGRPAAVDVTGGTSGMTAAAALAAPNEAGVFYFFSPQIGSMHECGKEVPHFVRRPK